MRLAEPLHGAHLTLRTLDVADARGPYRAWLSDADVLRYLEVRHGPDRLATLERFIDEANAHPSTLLLGIILSADRRHIGNIKLGPIDFDHRRGDIGIMLGDTSVWGRGYATEAISLLSEHAFGPLGLHKVAAGFYAGNAASVRAFEKAGFRLEARLPDHWRTDHAWQDGLLMARVNTAF